MITEQSASNSLDLIEVNIVAEHIALVTLNRPAARNAINAEMAQLLDDIVKKIEADDTIWVIILTGSGDDVFCAGADLKAVSAGQAANLFTKQGFAGFVDAERSKPWIAAVNGKALAGGCEIALACDLILATEFASFGIPEVSRGVLAAAGGLYRLPRALPRNVAIEMALTGESISAKRAAELGLVNSVVRDDLLSEAISLARRITKNAPIAVRESLRIIKKVPDLNTNELRSLTTERRNRVAESNDYKEGPRAFIEKRAPRWTGV